MEIEVHQRGGILGLDRRYVVRDGTIEVIDRGTSRGSRELSSEQRSRIAELASSAADAPVEQHPAPPVSDAMETDVAIRHEDGDRRLNVRTGDTAPAAVWDLIGEVSRASGD
jgi:hypothetical protein